MSTRRDDVSQIYFKKVYDRDFGFDIRFPYERGKTYWLLIRCEGRQAKIKFNEELIAKRASVAHKRLQKIRTEGTLLLSLRSTVPVFLLSVSFPG